MVVSPLSRQGLEAQVPVSDLLLPWACSLPVGPTGPHKEPSAPSPLGCQVPRRKDVEPRLLGGHGPAVRA